ncbi:sensor histidine kinase [Thalassotalea marina]|uniref:HAMP domain-containing protein n=1 Tax=Thalassotalea marina TaxID=1673741 RepID=A0A919EIU7_9GAMM|nr:histidine kinase [Thalassotalea marina]GHF84361.1 hypothetical protein GCM10017161_09710 [Thalassotalea marina]
MKLKETLVQLIKPSLKLQFLLIMLAVSYLGTVSVLLILVSLFSNPSGIQQQQFSTWYQNHVLTTEHYSTTDSSSPEWSSNISTKLSNYLNKTVNIESLGQVDFHWFVLVDKNAFFIKAYNTDNYHQGDLTSQLPMNARDDLADALVGRFNSGIEPLANNNKLVIKAIKSDDGEILGALISEQTWHFPTNYSLLDSVFNASSLKSILFIALAPMALILLVVLILLVIASKRLKSDWQQFTQVISFWQQGDFSSKLPTDKPSEIANSFSQLNAMADALAQHIEKQQQQTEVRERQLLAAELHDTVKQTLFANNLALATALNMLNQDNHLEAMHYLQEAIKGNQTAFGQMSQLIDTLPTNDTQAIEINTFISAFKHEFNAELITIDITHELTHPISAENLILCQKVMTEALQNVKKHSKATRIKVHFSQSEQGKLLHCYIVDDGKVTHITPQQGLNLMKKRIEQASGIVTIAPGANKPYCGVEITLCLNN